MSVCRGRTLVGAGQGSQRFGRKRHSAGSVAGRGARRAGAAGRGEERYRCGQRTSERSDSSVPDEKKRSRSDRNLLKIRDSDRIQTCNLLIRSQVLYSVKLRSHSLIASANVGYFSGLCKFLRIKFIRPGKWRFGSRECLLLRASADDGRRSGCGVRTAENPEAGRVGERCPAMRE